MIARIYRPAKSATQSGRAKTKVWMLEYSRNEASEIDPLMGWTGSRDTSAQVKISFDTKEDAIAFAEKRGIAFELEEPAPAAERRGLSYADNFKSSRLGQWTH